MDTGLKKRAREILKTWKEVFDAAKASSKSPPQVISAARARAAVQARTAAAATTAAGATAPTAASANAGASVARKAAEGGGPPAQSAAGASGGLNTLQRQHAERQHTAAAAAAAAQAEKAQREQQEQEQQRQQQEQQLAERKPNPERAPPPMGLEDSAVAVTHEHTPYSRSRKWEGVDGSVVDGVWKPWDRAFSSTSASKRNKVQIQSYTLSFAVLVIGVLATGGGGSGGGCGVHAIDNGVGTTPPMGWRSWNAYHKNISQDKMTIAATAMVAKGPNGVSLLDAGFVRQNQ